MRHVSKLKKKVKKKTQSQKKEEEETEGSVQEKSEKKGKKDFSLLSKIYGDWTDSFRRSKRQSSSTHRELCVGTKILEFRQTSRGREFPTWVISNLKAI